MTWRIVGALLMLATVVCATRAHAACATNFGGQALPTSQFTINADETVNDGATGLMWQRCIQGLIDDTCSGPATNAAVFPNPGSWTVSSITAAAFNGTMGGDQVWLVEFDGGGSAQDDKRFGHVATNVRLVRSGPFDALAPPCNLDINDDGSVNAAKDGMLLLRYLLGFRGAALIDGVAIGPTRGGAAGVEAFIGTAAKYDVFGRTAPIVTALSDGLVLIRLMNGLPDTALLNGVPLPTGTTNTTAVTVRDAVNTRCGTIFEARCSA